MTIAGARMPMKKKLSEGGLHIRPECFLGFLCAGQFHRVLDRRRDQKAEKGMRLLVVRQGFRGLILEAVDIQDFLDGVGGRLRVVDHFPRGKGRRRDEENRQDGDPDGAAQREWFFCQGSCFHR
jgi:hypothetical protein